ncbi:hypothetical protein ACWF8M_32400, partial [Streptomyces sp. NPDC055008]
RGRGAAAAAPPARRAGAGPPRPGPPRPPAAAPPAANRADSLAAKSAKAAREARDAANASAEHAEKAAAAAKEAAEHAGEAATAAAESTKHAAAAKTAADAASAAVQKAKDTFTLAREVEAEELASRTAGAVEQARSLRDQDDERIAEGKKQADAATALDSEATELAEEISASGENTDALAPKARKVALNTVKTRGPWSVSAAEVALAGSADDVVRYVAEGREEAAALDRRARAETLATDSTSADVRTAAAAVVEEGDAPIQEFLKTGQFQAVSNDLRVRITQLMNGAGPGVKEAGQAALNDGSPSKLRDFVDSGYYVQRANDERVQATQLVGSGTPEEKAAARIALEGPPQVLHAFTETGRFKAKRQDLLTATHTARVQGLIASAAKVAAVAQQNAALAGETAAKARKAAAEAKKYADQAKASAEQAASYSKDADASADAAQKSADQAAKSAKTARAAEADAHAAARDADHSVARAEASAASAHGSANSAWAAAGEARASAEAAGKDADAAAEAMTEALNVAAEKQWAEIRKALEDEQDRADEASLQALEEYFADLAKQQESGDTDWWDLATLGHTVLDTAGLVPGFGEIADGINCGWYGAEGDSLNAGLSCAAMIPFLGWGATGGKWGKRGVDAIEAFNKAMRAEGKVPHIWSANPKKGLSNAQNAFSHWKKHRAEFSELNNAQDYVKLARNYGDIALKGKPAAGYRVYRQNGGSVAIFDKSNGAWAAFTKDGIPQTMYKPKPKSASNPNGYEGTLEDWLAQPGRGTEIR